MCSYSTISLVAHAPPPGIHLVQLIPWQSHLKHNYIRLLNHKWHTAHITIKVQVIRNTAHRPSTRASYMIGSGTTMQENHTAAQIAARHNIFSQMAPYMSWIFWCWWESWCLIMMMQRLHASIIRTQTARNIVWTSLQSLVSCPVSSDRLCTGHELIENGWRETIDVWGDRIQVDWHGHL